jgi:hypothetical protein
MTEMSAQTARLAARRGRSMTPVVIGALIGALWLVGPAFGHHSSHPPNGSQRKGITRGVKAFFVPSARSQFKVRGIRIGNRTHWARAMAIPRTAEEHFQSIVFGLRRVHGRWKVKAEQHTLGCPPAAVRTELHFEC